MILSLALLLLLAPEKPPAAPVDVFAALNGTWEGTFVGYDETGKELYRIRVRQTYRRKDDNTQTVVIEDRKADGTVIRGEGRNLAHRQADGSLKLVCRVEKSNGDRVEHQGREILGPDGDHQIIWSSVSQGRTETFREAVRREGDRWVYTIDGMGKYGGTLILMAGRYVKKER